ncbi:unnamed protein product [Cuscuta europaea]|uniref:Uncharacterized protein n=1 Tax=Cuscuta europaea TaxID=41803 RepID=A0A9P0ZB83_CUSEU|nr:unnamed protein product [Cuscuta europaea]
MEFDFVKPIWGVYGFHLFIITHPKISSSICMATLKSQHMLLFLALFLISSSILPQASLSSIHPNTNTAMKSPPPPPSTTELHPSRKRLPGSFRNPSSSTQKPPDYGASYHEVPGGHNPASNRR